MLTSTASPGSNPETSAQALMMPVVQYLDEKLRHQEQRLLSQMQAAFSDMAKVIMDNKEVVHTIQHIILCPSLSPLPLPISPILGASCLSPTIQIPLPPIPGQPFPCLWNSLRSPEFVSLVFSATVQVYNRQMNEIFVQCNLRCTYTNKQCQ